MNASYPTTTIRPNQRFETGYMTTFLHAINNLIHYRELVWQLFKRDFFAVYKKSLIGSAWILLTPVAGILSWIFLHKTNIIRPGDVGVPYPAYVLVGTMMWGLFMGVFSAVMNVMSLYRFMLMKAHFPHEIIIGVQLLIKLSHFCVSFVITILLLIVFGIIPSYRIFLFPLIILPLLFFAIALGLFVSIMSIVSYDFKRVVTGVFGLVMFITPVIYSADAIKNEWLQTIMHLNPLTYLVCSARDIILFGRLYSLNGFIISSVISIFLLIVSWRIFYVSEDKIIERLI